MQLTSKNHGRKQLIDKRNFLSRPSHLTRHDFRLLLQVRSEAAVSDHFEFSFLHLHRGKLAFMHILITITIWVNQLFIANWPIWKKIYLHWNQLKLIVPTTSHCALHYEKRFECSGVNEVPAGYLPSNKPQNSSSSLMVNDAFCQMRQNITAAVHSVLCKEFFAFACRLTNAYVKQGKAKVCTPQSNINISARVLAMVLPKKR